jgi:hypothetical protein
MGLLPCWFLNVDELTIKRVAESLSETFSSTENEKCHFRFPHKSMTLSLVIDLGAPTGARR